MLAHPNVSMTSGDALRNDISTIRDNDHHNAQSQRELDEMETSKTKQRLVKAGKFIFSNVGLVGLVILYAVAGAFLFGLLEQYQDKLNCQEARGLFDVQQTQLKQSIVSYVKYNTTASVSASSPLTLTYSTETDNATVAYATIGSMLYSYRDFIINTGSEYRYYGDDCSVSKWTFIQALLFAITIITTIGYGNITPVTWEGQICCICYATIGIPIFLLCLANISGILGEMFRFLYGNVCCAPYNMIKRHREMVRKTQLAEESGMKGNRVNASGWEIDDDDDNNNNNNKSTKKGSNTLTHEQHTGDDDHQQDSRVTVPLTITMLIIAFYLWAGSMLFHAFEGWTSIQAGYFCFISLSTIGFGDFVPGQTETGEKATINLIIGLIYLLIGMAILAMCFDLMQEEIVAKFRWLGRKIGIVDKEEDLVVKPNDNIPNNNTRPSTASSVTGSSPTMNKNGNMYDDENENGWSSRPSSSGTRKHSPRNNMARVHPMGTSSNEGTLHQRAGLTKNN